MRSLPLPFQSMGIQVDFELKLQTRNIQLEEKQTFSK